MLHCVPEDCVTRIVVAPQIKFRFKLRVEQSDTINIITDKVQQYCINMSSRIAISEELTLQIFAATSTIITKYLRGYV